MVELSRSNFKGLSNLIINVKTQISQITTQVSCLNYDSHDCPQSASYVCMLGNYSALASGISNIHTFME